MQHNWYTSPSYLELEEREKGNLRKHTTDLLNNLVLTRGGILEIGRRGPVGTLVFSDLAGGAVTSAKICKLRGWPETCKKRFVRYVL